MKKAITGHLAQFEDNDQRAVHEGLQAVSEYEPELAEILHAGIDANLHPSSASAPATSAAQDDAPVAPPPSPGNVATLMDLTPDSPDSEAT